MYTRSHIQFDTLAHIENQPPTPTDTATTTETDTSNEKECNA